MTRTAQSGMERVASQAFGLSVLRVLFGSVVIAASAQVEVPLGFTPVPMTLQTLGVLLVGAALGSREGLAAAIAYLAEGAIGLPVFAGFGAGVTHLMGPTGGYLVGFLPAAWLSGLVWERAKAVSFVSLSLAMLAAHTLVFALGLSWLGVFVGYSRVLELGYVPFIPGEILKTLIAATVLRLARSRSSVG